MPMLRRRSVRLGDNDTTARWRELTTDRSVPVSFINSKL
jgi:hypothetical protein